MVVTFLFGLEMTTSIFMLCSVTIEMSSTKKNGSLIDSWRLCCALKETIVLKLKWIFRIFSWNLFLTVNCSTRNIHFGMLAFLVAITFSEKSTECQNEMLSPTKWVMRTEFKMNHKNHKRRFGNNIYLEPCPIDPCIVHLFVTCCWFQ